MYSPDGTNVSGLRGGEFEGQGRCRGLKVVCINGVCIRFFGEKAATPRPKYRYRVTLTASPAGSLG